MNSNMSLGESLKHDIPASVVVFLVALPLCLGIALASGAPLFSGLIAGIVGGILVGALSGSRLGVSGPAAGLAVIVFTAINSLGSFEAFLVAVVLAGLLQLAMGYLRAGVIGYYFPSSVIKGMLSGIGLTIILKQLPHAVGYDADPTGDMAFVQSNGENTLSALGTMLSQLQPGALVVGLVSMAILLLWDLPFIKRIKATTWIQGPLVAVVMGVVLNQIFADAAPALAIKASHLVQIPMADGLSGLVGLLTFPDFSQLSNSADAGGGRQPGNPAVRRGYRQTRPLQACDPHQSRAQGAGCRQRDLGLAGGLAGNASDRAQFGQHPGRWANQDFGDPARCAGGGGSNRNSLAAQPDSAVRACRGADHCRV